MAMSMQDLEVSAAERGAERREPRPPGAEAMESGLGAWASAISADDNAQAAIALAEAINRARNSQATRENRAADARVIATGRLETLRARLAPIYAAIPRDVELFDLGVVSHAPPRLFIDIIAFVEMAADGRSFRLFQETRAGRILLGESADEKQMMTLVTNYIAERLVERERALASVGAQMKTSQLPKAAAQPAPALAHAPPEKEEAAALEKEKAAALEKEKAAAPASDLKPISALPGVVPALAQAGPAIAAATTAAATAAMAATQQRRSGSGWLWPVAALAIGMALGALALYLYALSLNRA
jgi:hypothetical protein